MKVLVVAGTRPEIIRLVGVVRTLEELSSSELTVAFRVIPQNFDPGLLDVFLKEFELDPACIHGARPTAALTSRELIARVETLLDEEKPDRVLILGDTNTAFSVTVACTKRSLPIYHLEAGNRCWNPASPEESNRRAIDHAAGVVHLCYTEGARRNLLAEGIPLNRIYVVGNPIVEALQSVATCGLLRPSNPEHVLLTLHRAETVGDGGKDAPIHRILQAAIQTARDVDLPVVWPVHPRTQALLAQHDAHWGASLPGWVELQVPLGFKEFVTAEEEAEIIITDSGTVQEEAAILGIPCVVARDATERPETVEAGCSVVTGTTAEGLRRGIAWALKRNEYRDSDDEEAEWTNPYPVCQTTQAVAAIVLGAPPL